MALPGFITTNFGALIFLNHHNMYIAVFDKLNNLYGALYIPYREVGVCAALCTSLWGPRASRWLLRAVYGCFSVHTPIPCVNYTYPG